MHVSNTKAATAAHSSKEQHQESYGIMFGVAVVLTMTASQLKFGMLNNLQLPQLVQVRVKVLTNYNKNISGCLIPASELFLLLHSWLFSCCAVVLRFLSVAS
jgi:hypothetical protein